MSTHTGAAPSGGARWRGRRAAFGHARRTLARAYIRAFSAPRAAAAKSQGAHLRVHYKNSVEVAAAIRGMDVKRAKVYLNNVLLQKEAIPFKIFKGGRGRHAQVR